MKWQFLDGEHTDLYDIYGDRTLKTIFTPGHSPGHQSILVTLPNSGSLLLAIDAAYTIDHWDEKVLPGFMSSLVEAVRSAQKMKAIVDRTEAQVVTGHDPDAWLTFRHTPEYYD